MTLTEQMELVRRREQAARLDQGEQAVLAKVADQLPQPPAFDQATREALQPFIAWTTAKSVRYAPCKPAIVSAFLLDQVASGTSTSTILRRVSAISALHDH
jgi:hypothetical protein